MVAQTLNPPGNLKKKVVFGDITNKAPSGSLAKGKQSGNGIVVKKAPKVFIFEEKSEPRPTTVPTVSPEKETEDPSLAAIGCGSEGGILTDTLFEVAVDDVQRNDEAVVLEATTSAGEKETVEPLLFGKGDAVFYADETGNKVKARVIGTRPLLQTYIVMLVDSNKFLCGTKDEQLSPRKADSPDEHPYWNSIDARKLFHPTKSETVLDAIDNQIALLDAALESIDGWKSIVKGGADFPELFKASDVERVKQKAHYISTSLKKARHKMPWFSWTDCCKEAVEDLKAEGVTYYKGVTNLYRHFRAQRFVECPKVVEKQIEKQLEHIQCDLLKQLFIEDDSE